MAYQKRGVWYIYVTGPDGRKRPQATTARSAKEADKLKKKLDEQAREAAALKAQRDALGEMSWDELLDWYHQEEGRHLKSQTIFGTVDKYVRPKLGEASIHDEPADRFESLLNEIRASDANPDGLSTATLNRLRTTVRSAFALAVRRKRIPKPNPIGEVKTYRTKKAARVLLDEHELPLMMAKVPVQWRAVFALELIFASRKSEILGIEVAQVDTRNWEIEFERGKVDDKHRLRIPEQLRPYIVDALERAKAKGSRFLFSRADGSKYGIGEVDLVGILRTACGKAGIVTGWRYVCRRSGCGFRDELPTKDEARDCPRCDFRLQVVGVPKRVTFRGLRASVATAADRAGAPLSWVQGLLGHASPKTTMEWYVEKDARVSERVAAMLPYQLPQAVAAARTGTDNATGALPDADHAGAPKQEAPESGVDSGASSGRPDWFRTNDLFRVKDTGESADAGTVRNTAENTAIHEDGREGDPGEVTRSGAVGTPDATRNATRTLHDANAHRYLSALRARPMAIGMAHRPAPVISLAARKDGGR